MYLLSDKVRVAVGRNERSQLAHEPRTDGASAAQKLNFWAENLSLLAVAESEGGRGGRRRDRLLMAVNGHAFKFFRIRKYRASGRGRTRRGRRALPD